MNYEDMPDGMVRVTLDLTPREARFLWRMILDCQGDADSGCYYPDENVPGGDPEGQPATLDEWTELAEKIARQIKGVPGVAA